MRRKTSGFALTEGGTHAGIVANPRKCGFTLAEVLITITIIGVVAAIVIPWFVENVQNQAWSAEKANFNMKINEAMNQMKTNDALTGYATNEEFVETFKKYMKITRVCDSSNLTSCFVPMLKAGDGTEVDTVKKLRTGEDFGKDNYTSPLMGVQFANGIQGLVAYNPDCAYVNPYDNHASATGCLSILYDINGSSKPNQANKDIMMYNVDKLGPTCAFKIGSTCYSAAFMPEAMSYADCNAQKAKLGIHCCPTTGIVNCGSVGDYWAGAFKHCKDQGLRLPTTSELEDIARTLYPTLTPDGSNPNIVRGTLSHAKARDMGLLASDKMTFQIWTNEEPSSFNYAVAGTFQYTSWYYFKNITNNRSTPGPDNLNATWATTGLCVE